MQNELKPCPFCGGKPHISKHSFWNEKTKGFTDHTYGIECIECHTKGNQFYETEKEAIEAWNRRADNG